MPLTAHCPSCQLLLPLAGDQSLADAPAVTGCQCGARVIVCIDSPATVDAQCTQCGTTYAVATESFGGALDCDCGAIVVVPMVATPVRPDHSGGIVRGDQPSAEPSSVAQTQTECPQCGQEYFSLAADRGKSARCECGCLFGISKRDGRARRLQPPAESVVSPTGDQPDVTPGSVESQPRSSDRRRVSGGSENAAAASGQTVTPGRQIPWFQIAMGAGVAGLLVVGIVMFWRSENRRSQVVATESGEPSSVQRYGSVSDPAEGTGGAADRDQPGPADPPRSETVAVDASVKPAGATPGSGDSTSDAVAAGRRAGQKPIDRPIELPAKAAVRFVVPVSQPRSRGLTFKATYEAAFNAFERATEMQADAESGNAETVAEYRDSLGLAIGWMQRTLARCGEDTEGTKEHEMRYLLAYMSFLGGRLADAAVYGEAAARWGDPADKATREAAMIALAAMQEANATHWGIDRQVGELDRMQGIAELIQQRWPDEPQRDLIWASLAQSYESFGQDREAIAAFAKVRRSSDQFITAKLSAGRLHWKLYQSTQSAADLAAADKEFRQGVKLMAAAKDTPVKTIVTTKLTLARIAARQKRPAQVVTWLTKGAGSPVKYTTNSAGKGFKLSQSLSAVVFETLAQAHQSQGDVVAGQAALASLAEVSPADAARVDALQWRSVTELAEAVSAAASRKRGKLTAKQLDSLDRVAKPVSLDDPKVPVSEVLWFGEIYAGLAKRAAPALRRRCVARAIEVYQAAMRRADFPATSMIAAQLRVGELMSAAGRHEDSLMLIGEVLASHPNAFDLQFQAAETLTLLAGQQPSEADLRECLSGRRGTKIWGWFKFVQVLFPVRHSDSGTEKHVRQLRTAQLRLAQTQWQLSDVISDVAEKASLRASVKKQLVALESSLNAADDQWRQAYQQICDDVGMTIQTSS